MIATIIVVENVRDPADILDVLILGVALAVVLALQVALGIANVLAGLPLSVAVAHNAVAAVLLVTMVMINFALSRTTPKFS